MESGPQGVGLLVPLREALRATGLKRGSFLSEWGRLGLSVKRVGKRRDRYVYRADVERFNSERGEQGEFLCVSDDVFAEELRARAWREHEVGV